MRLYSTRVDTLLVLLALGWFFLFAHHGLSAPFSGDDLMNLHGYLSRSTVSLLVDNLCYWSTAYRPLGGLFYSALYHYFGFDPLPFRVACFAIMTLNLGLLWRFTLRLSGSRETAFLALLIAGYHAWFVDLYYSTGTIYDLLCYAFYLGSFNLCLRVRPLAWRHLAVLIVLYVCALNAKEMAVTLPVLLAAYELIYHRHALRESGFAWLLGAGRGVLVTSLLTLPYVAGKLLCAGSLVENPAYHLSISPGRYLDTFHLYLNPLLYQDHVFRDPNTIQLLLAMLALALCSRSRPLLFAWCFVLLSLLPVAFIAHYSAFFLYLPMAGWSLYAAGLLVIARRLLTSLVLRFAAIRGGQEKRLHLISVITLPVLLALFLAPQHRRESVKTLHIFETAQPPSRQLAAEMLALRPTLPRGGHVLFVGDPFAPDEYFLLFLTRLLYRDMSLTVDRTSPQQPLRRHHFDAVFTFQCGHLLSATRHSGRPLGGNSILEMRPEAARVRNALVLHLVELNRRQEKRPPRNIVIPALDGFLRGRRA
ncbi:hypothetical protein [Paludibaculum fermentans]|uniref:hypothetical protein n=1 Tax=Paludibaculum fermentans TaxID=1473598 RepID=UPI003EB7C956